MITENTDHRPTNLFHIAFINTKTSAEAFFIHGKLPQIIVIPEEEDGLGHIM